MIPRDRWSVTWYATDTVWYDIVSQSCNLFCYLNWNLSKERDRHCVIPRRVTRSHVVDRVWHDIVSRGGQRVKDLEVPYRRNLCLDILWSKPIWLTHGRFNSMSKRILPCATSKIYWHAPCISASSKHMRCIQRSPKETPLLCAQSIDFILDSDVRQSLDH